MAANQSKNDAALRARLIQRAAESDAPLLAAPLKRYADLHGWTWEQLAVEMRLELVQLNKVAACRQPRADSYDADINSIADYIGVLPTLIDRLLRGALASQTDYAMVAESSPIYRTDTNNSD